ncbi:hypothetical protein TREMEDRAFT_73826 [Tremella mesenterica DSM 1558]|uniref:uncharacterized protein n=1 Tax=Tremella mesenterica (strain ATCC 24925 / CBS 8224 / DSM 1558 / NBRC 9311 / NRRL Y-6157 / RJB 2259-6 / UBC 559-6) TaxID=578456 RepID=UPI0003F49181|nr:uncharacterized protein TREMEDRAFT_73826 [Tremella mesenterica DSM 1558]EIW69358.1 hypothetical protein TREMEDRAFT_73826 [Tremella mesenterica DSM 1558]
MTSKPQLEAVSAEDAAMINEKPSKRPSGKRDMDEDDDDDDDESDSDVSMVNVDFDFYNLNPDVDQITVKRFLRQTLSTDEEMIDVHPLATLILEEASRMRVGSSIKTDGEESDPWGLLAAVDINRNRTNPSLSSLLTYFTSTLSPRSPLRIFFDVSSSPAISNSPFLLFSLRMLNLPLPLIPPLYTMLLSELTEAEESGRIPKITHFLLWGRGYRLEGNEESNGLDMVDGDVKGKGNGKGGQKRKRQQSGMIGLGSGSFPYHPEEEFIDKVASHVHTYPFKNSQKRDDDSLGVEQYGRLILVERDNLARAVKAMTDVK